MKRLLAGFLFVCLAAGAQAQNINVSGTTSGLTSAEVAGLMQGYLNGLTLSNSGGDATNDIDIATGAATDGGNAVVMTLAASLTKRLDAAWAVGTNAGGLDTGAIANTTYHVWLIRRSDTGVVDALFSTSASAPTMPTSYDQKRRIGSILRESAAIVLFTQQGDYFRRSASVQDISANNPGTAAVTATLSVPTGVNVHAIVNAHITGTTAAMIHLSDLAAADEAPSSSAAPQAWTGGNASQDGRTPGMVRTNTSAQIRYRLNASDATDTIYIATLGWWDYRSR